MYIDVLSVYMSLYNMLFRTPGSQKWHWIPCNQNYRWSQGPVRMFRIEQIYSLEENRVLFTTEVALQSFHFVREWEQSH